MMVIRRWWIGWLFFMMVMGPAAGVRGSERADGVVPMDDMVVTAMKQETAVEEIPASVSVISREMLLNQNLPNGDIGDALRRVPGLTLRRAYAPFPSFANIRGMGGGATLFLVDGIPTDAQISQTLPLEMIEKVEIIRGPVSALYGANAGGGVVNIILKQGDDAPAGTLGIGAGRFGRLRSAAAANGRSSEFDFAVAGMYEEADGANVVPNNINPGIHMIDNCSYDKRSVGFNMGYTPLQETRMRLFYNFFNDRYLRGRPHVGGDWDYNLAGFTLDQGVGNRLNLKVLVGFRKDHYVHLSDNSGTDYDPRQKRFTDYKETPAEVRATLALDGGHDLTAGLAYNNQDTQQDYRDWLSQARTQENKYKVRTTAVFVQDAWKPIQPLTLSVGLRYDHWKNYDNYFSGYDTANPQDRSDDHLSPRVGLRYHLTAATSIWGSYSTGFTPPTSEQLYDDRTSGGNSRVPNPDLTPETTSAYEIGIQHRFGRRVQMGLAGFYNLTDDKILSWFNADNVLTNANIGQTESYGVELDFAADLFENWTLTANYTYNKATIKENPADPTLEGNLLTFSPEHKANLGITYRRPDSFTLSLFGRYLGKQYCDDANTETAASGDPLAMAASFVVDVKATKHLPVAWGALKSVDLSLSVDNLLDEDYRSFYMYEDSGPTLYAEVRCAF